MTIVLDIETKQLASEVGGFPALIYESGEISVACTLEVETGLVRVWDGFTVTQLAEYLSAATAVVTFNGDHFDLPIIQRLAGGGYLINSVDLKHSFPGFSLDRLGYQILGRGKTGSGTNAVTLYREGRIGELVDYCLQDVYLTKDIWTATQMCGTIDDVANSARIPQLPADPFGQP